MTSQRKEIEEEVQIILEKIEPLIKDDILTELREKHGDPKFYSPAYTSRIL